ncbi:MAG: alpha/beta hydrolase [Patescibacteria group bacterium]
MKSKPQIFVIHGGSTFKKHKDYLRYLKTRKISIDKDLHWRQEYLNKELGRKFQLIHPRMPSSDNSQYEEWKINLERHFPYLRKNIILIGESLGGIFLAKYLSENKFPKKILATYLVCAPFDNTIPRESLGGGFKLKKNLSLLQKNSPNLTLMFSGDDNVVPVSHAEKYRVKLPNAKIIIYRSKNGHFRVPKFPEIVRMIKENYKIKRG